MPAVIHTPEVIDSEAHDLYEAYDLQEEQPRTRSAHAGFWHTLVQYVREHRVHRLQRTPSLSHVSVHKFEMPVDAWAQRYPALYIQAFAGQ